SRVHAPTVSSLLVTGAPPILYLLAPPLPFFFFPAAAPAAIYTLSLHDALPIFRPLGAAVGGGDRVAVRIARGMAQVLVHPLDERSEEHTSELQSRFDLVCRLLLEKKKTSSARAVPAHLSQTPPRARHKPPALRR